KASPASWLLQGHGNAVLILVGAKFRYACSDSPGVYVLAYLGTVKNAARFSTLRPHSGRPAPAFASGSAPAQRACSFQARWILALRLKSSSRVAWVISSTT